MQKSNGSIESLDFDKQHTEWPSTESAPVLVVDDDRQFLEMISIVLSHHYDFKVTKAGNAFEALSCLDGKNFKFVITDLQMPGMDGLVLASTIKERYPSMIIVLITGVNLQMLEGKQGLENIDLFIQKPFKIGTFLNTIEEIVNRP